MEGLVALLLAVAGVCAAAFAVLYVLDASTQLLGLSLGLAFAALAAALVVAGKRVVPQETAILDKPPLPDPEEREEGRELVRDGGEGVSRRALIVGAAGVAGCGLGAALVLPIASLGPGAEARVGRPPGGRGGGPGGQGGGRLRCLVDEEGERFGPDDLALGGFLTAFPEGADKEEVGSPVILARLR